jgi:polyphosphate kinase 2 (PPK2 family)
MGQVNEFEKMLVESGTYLIKFYFSITKTEQAKRFKEIRENPLKRWKITPVDLKAQELWDEYTKYKQKMWDHTDTKTAPWTIIKANQKTKARMKAVDYILDIIPYKE